MKLSELPPESWVGLMVKRSGTPESPGDEYGIVVKVDRFSSGLSFEASVGCSSYIGCSPKRWDVVPLGDEDATPTTWAFEFMIAKQESLSAMDGFLLAMNAARRLGLPTP